jgi:hypothetical protein
VQVGKESLACDTVSDATSVEIEELKWENVRLKQLVAELTLQVHVLKKTSAAELE